MKRFTVLITLMVICLWAFPAAFAMEESPWQDWEPTCDYSGNGLYGYKSGNEWVIPPQYDMADWFDEEGRAVARKDGKAGIIDATGAWLIPLDYDDFGWSGPDGLRWFKLDGKYGVMTTGGEVVHPADIVAGWMGDFMCGSAVYVEEVSGKYGLVSRDGKYITEPIYDEIKSWKATPGGTRSARRGELWGLLAPDGTELTPFDYDWLGLWSNGYAEVRKEGKYAVLKPNGEELTRFVFDYVEWGDPDSEDRYERYNALPDGDLAYVTQNGLCGALSLTTGELAYPCAFAGYSGLVTAIQMKLTDPAKLWETAERLGREAGCQVTWYPGESMIRLYGSDRVVRVKGGKCALSGLDGMLYTGYDYDIIQPLGRDGLFHAAKNGKWGKLDANGNMAVEFLYDTQSSIGANARFVSKWPDGSPPYALFTLDGKPITDHIYWAHTEFINGYAMVSDGTEAWGYIDTAGKSVSERKYVVCQNEAAIRMYSDPFEEDGFAIVQYNSDRSKFNIIDAQGHELLKEPSCNKPWRAGFGLFGYVDRENYKMGFIDSAGNVVIQPQYFYMEPRIKGGPSVSDYVFNEDGLLTVSCYEKESGERVDQTIDITGKVVDAGRREVGEKEGRDFYEGLCWLSPSAKGSGGSGGGAWGFETETGELIVPHIYDAVGRFDHGYALVQAGNIGRKWDENFNLNVSGAVCGLLKNPLKRDVISDWAKAEVKAAAEAGYVTGSCAHYQTYTITRAQFASLAVNYLEKRTGETIDPAPADTFTDTADDAVLKACAAGIVQGVGEGRFDPDGPLDWEQLATMLWRAMQRAGVGMHYGPLTDYADANRISDWAEFAMNNLVHNGVMSGTGGNMLSPKASCTVEQAILLVCRAKELPGRQEDEARRQAALDRVTIQGLAIGTPFDELPVDLREALKPQGEPYDGWAQFGLPGRDISQKYTAPGIEIITSRCTSETLENALKYQDEAYLQETFGSGDRDEIYVRELNREYVHTVTLTDGRYQLVSGLKVGDSEERARELGHGAYESFLHGETSYSLGSTKITWENGVITEIQVRDMIGRRIGPFFDP